MYQLVFKHFRALGLNQAINEAANDPPLFDTPIIKTDDKFPPMKICKKAFKPLKSPEKEKTPSQALCVTKTKTRNESGNEKLVDMITCRICMSGWYT